MTAPHLWLHGDPTEGRRVELEDPDAAATTSASAPPRARAAGCRSRTSPPAGPRSAPDLRTGDVVRSVDGRAVSSPEV